MHADSTSGLQPRLCRLLSPSPCMMPPLPSSGRPHSPLRCWNKTKPRFYTHENQAISRELLRNAKTGVGERNRGGRGGDRFGLLPLESLSPFPPRPTFPPHKRVAERESGCLWVCVRCTLESFVFYL